MRGHWAALLPTPQPDSPSPIEASSLGIWALQFTPRVALLEAAVVADVADSARLFGDLQQLHALVEAGALQLGAKVAWAPTALAALALVRHAATSDTVDGFRQPLAQVLDPLPLEALTAVGVHRPTLARVGCRTLGDVRRLPRGGLGRRFDPALLVALDQAYGLRPQAFDWLVLPDTFQARLELMSRVETAGGADRWPDAVQATRHFFQLYEQRARWAEVEPYAHCLFELAEGRMDSSPGEAYRRR